MSDEINLDHCCGDKCTDDIISAIVDYENENSQLEDRLISLKNRMADIKKLLHATKTQLNNNKDLLKKGTVETSKISETNLTNDMQMLNICTEPTLNDMTILDYEQTLSVYRDACAKAHAEKRMHLRRHLANNDFKQRLLEVESMCNMELIKIKQNMQLLQPLQAIASQWSFDNENLQFFDEEITGATKFGKSTEIKEITSASDSRSSFETSSS